MKTKLFFLGLLFVSCAGDISTTSNADHPPSFDTKGIQIDPPFSLRMGKFTVRLRTDDSQCVLEYSSDGAKPEQLDTNMEGPCDFIGRRTKPFSAQTFEFGKGQKKVTILLVTGGPAHPKFHDEFMPLGCGTRLARVRIYSDRIEVQEATEPSKSALSEPSVYCPSNPLDEVFFATG